MQNGYLGELPITWIDFFFGFIMLSCGLYASYMINFHLGGWRAFYHLLVCDEEKGERSKRTPSPSSP